jgi:hypothetical protein
MKRIIFKIVGIILCVLFIHSIIPSKAQELKEGDIIFQTSQSKQSPLIAFATMSNKTHCGIIVEKDSKLYVLETLGTIQLTPLQTFIDRGLFKKYWVKRGINKPINYQKYLGIPYDLAFKFDNGKFYCSELVYTIYLEQFGLQLCKPKQIKEYNTLGLKSHMNRRHMSATQYVVSPDDLFTSKHLKSVK